MVGKHIINFACANSRPTQASDNCAETFDMDFKKGDICICARGWSAGCYVITEMLPDNGKYCCSTLHLVTNKHYQLDPACLIKIGEASADLDVAAILASVHAPPSLPREDSEVFQFGKLRAEYEAYNVASPDAARWRLLATAKPGDMLVVSTRGRMNCVKFHNVLERGEKFVFLAEESSGKTFRYPLSSLMGTNRATKA